MMTFNEAQKKTGLSRRVIQEYENANLAEKPKTKNKYGHLEYSEEAVEHLYLLRMYREMDYGKKQIEEALFDKDYDNKSEIDRQLNEIIKKRDDLEKLIKVAKVISTTGFSQFSLRAGIPVLWDASYDDLTELLGAFSLIDGNVIFETEKLPDEILMEWECKLEIVLQELESLFRSGIPFESLETQNRIKSFHELLSKYITSSIILLSGLVLIIRNDQDMIDLIDEEYGNGASEYLFSAIRQYCFDSVENDFDDKFLNSCDEILILSRRSYKSSSEEVQQLVRQMISSLDEAEWVSEKTKIEIVKIFLRQMKDCDFIEYLDCKCGKGATDFLVDAIETYYENNAVHLC